MSYSRCKQNVKEVFFIYMNPFNFSTYFIYVFKSLTQSLQPQRFVRSPAGAGKCQQSGRSSAHHEGKKDKYM